MENTEYIMSSLDEYFSILDKENKKRSELVAKSLVKYLQKTKEVNKFQALQLANLKTESGLRSRSIKIFWWKW